MHNLKYRINSGCAYPMWNGVELNCSDLRTDLIRLGSSIIQATNSLFTTSHQFFAEIWINRTSFSTAANVEEDNTVGCVETKTPVVDLIGIFDIKKHNEYEDWADHKGWEPSDFSATFRVKNNGVIDESVFGAIYELLWEKSHDITHMSYASLAAEDEGEDVSINRPFTVSNLRTIVLRV